jgi:hypothetical protein
MNRMDKSPSQIFRRAVGTRTKMLKIIYDHRERMAHRNKKNRLVLIFLGAVLAGSTLMGGYLAYQSLSAEALQKMSHQWMNQVSVYKQPQAKAPKAKPAPPVKQQKSTIKPEPKKLSPASNKKKPAKKTTNPKKKTSASSSR